MIETVRGEASERAIAGVRYTRNFYKKSNCKQFIAFSLMFILILALLPNVIAAETEYNLKYDANGNLIQDKEYYYEYNSLNQLVRVREASSVGKIVAEYSYDENGQRIKKLEYSSGVVSKTTYYVDKSFVREINSSGTKDTVYYHDEDGLVGRKDSSGKLYFYHTNHLGSTDIVTDITGSVVEETKYAPFGEIIQGGESRYLFTGQENDKETDLMYYGARYYSPYMKHFTQPDSVMPDVYDPQQLNKYSYARNNPVKYIDKNGHFAMLATALIGAVIGAAIGSAMSIATQLATSGSVSWGAVAKSAGIGAVSGAVAGLTFGVGTALLGTTTAGMGLGTEIGLGAAAGITSGRAAQVTANAFEGAPLTQNLFNPSDIALDAGIGAAFGAASYGMKTMSARNFVDPIEQGKTSIQSSNSGLNKGSYTYQKGIYKYRVDIDGRAHNGMAQHTHVYKISTVPEGNPNAGAQYTNKVGARQVSQQDVSAVTSNPGAGTRGGTVGGVTSSVTQTESITDDDS